MIMTKAHTSNAPRLLRPYPVESWTSIKPEGVTKLFRDLNPRFQQQYSFAKLRNVIRMVNQFDQSTKASLFNLMSATLHNDPEDEQMLFLALCRKGEIQQVPDVRGA